MHIWTDLRNMKLGDLKVEVMMEVDNNVWNVWSHVCMNTRGFR